MEPAQGETSEVLLIPEEIFTPEALRERRRHLHGHGVRSRLEYFDEAHVRGPHYRLTLVGPAHEMSWASLSFSFFDDREFLGRRT